MRSSCPRRIAFVPTQPDDSGETTARCYEAGASVVHVHTRDRHGRNSGDPHIYAEIIRQIRAANRSCCQQTSG